MFVSSTYRITGLRNTFGCPPSVQPVFGGFTYRVTEVDYTYGCATLSVAYECKLHLQNHRVTPQLWLRRLKCSLSWKALPTELMGYTTLKSI